MALIDWFKRLAGVDGASPTEAPPAAADMNDKGAEIAGLNFMTAIDAHMRWKTRLENYIQAISEEDLKVEVVSRDDQCQLGRWIHGPGGERYAEIDVFDDMKRAHAEFHRCAGTVLAETQAGRRKEALALLVRGDYVRASERVKMLLAKLFVLLDERRRAGG